MTGKSFFSCIHVLQAVILSASASVFFTVLVPVQTFLANQDMFDYGAWDVLCAVLPWTVCVFCALTIVLMVCEKLFGRMLAVVVSGLLICEYLEIGVLSIGLPPLNGGILIYGNFIRKFLDFGVICVILSLWLALYRWTKGFAHWAAVIVIALMVASLFDVRKERHEVGGPLEGGYCSLAEVAGSVRFSRNGNVIVLVLDSFPSSVASKIIRKEPGLLSDFQGFTAYDNNVGMHGYTQRGLPGLMTGRFIRSDESAADYMNSVFGKESFLYPYVCGGNPVYYSSDMLTHGYTNQAVAPQMKAGTASSGSDSSLPILDRPSNGVPYLTLRDVCDFRLRLYRWKVSVLYRAYRRMRQTRTADTACVHERDLYPMTLNNEISADAPKTLCVFHTAGVHQPVLYDRNGETLPRPSDSLSAHEEYGAFVLRQVADFLKGLRQRGVYDNSLVVITADHGLECLRKGDGKDGYGSDTPMLWVKPIESHADFSSSRLPTSHVKICQLVVRSKDADLKVDDVDKILTTRDRHFYEQFGTSRWAHGNLIYFYRWTYDDDGKVISCVNVGRYQCQ